MPVSSIFVSNFKGVADPSTFRIAPLTIFLGPNSSGKSSALHALAALAQTVKLGDVSRRIVLDDEFAQVHLGRFIEIIHSKKYADSIELGLTIGERSVALPRFAKKAANETVSGDVRAKFTFRSTLRTQEVFVDSAVVEIGSRSISFTKHGSNYRAKDSATGKSFPSANTTNFFFEVAWDATGDRDWLDVMVLARELQRMIGDELRKTLYLGPFRQSPRRRYPFRGSMPLEVGAQGEAAVSLLASEHVASKTRTHTIQIGKWLNNLQLASKVHLGRVGSSDLFDVNLTLPDNVSLPIADLGYGVSQVLPVLAQCSFAPSESTLLFEQPELHLHPAAAARLAEIFVEVINEKKVNIVAETHSIDFFLRIIALLNAKKLQVDQVMAYDVKRVRGKSQYEPIAIVDDDGHVEVDHPWSKGLREG